MPLEPIGGEADWLGSGGDLADNFWSEKGKADHMLDAACRDLFPFCHVTDGSTFTDGVIPTMGGKNISDQYRIRAGCSGGEASLA